MFKEIEKMQTGIRHKRLPMCRCVYLLYKGDYVIYIGQASRFSDRIFDHYRKDYDEFEIIEIDEGESINDIEALFIAKYLPPLNKDMPSNNLFISECGIKKFVNNNFEKYKFQYQAKFLKQFDLKVVFKFNGLKYYSKAEIREKLI